MAAYQIYRSTTLGLALESSLNEMLEYSFISEELKEKVLKKFDCSMTNALENKADTRLKFTAKLDNYRLCDNVWTLTMSSVEFRDNFKKTFTVDKLKMVAVEGKTDIPPPPKSKAAKAQPKKKNPTTKRRRR